MPPPPLPCLPAARRAPLGRALRVLGLLAALPLLACADGPRPGAAGDGAAVAAPPPPAPTEASRPTPPPADTAGPAPATYDLARPDATFRLPGRLREISGLAVLPDGRLAAVQDERGALFVLDPATGAVLSETRFGRNGDYEGVEWAPGAVWVLESNGTLHEIPEGGGEVVRHETALRRRCDAEGLALDAARGRLLIACKEAPGAGLDAARHRAVYAFDLATRTLAAEPAFVLERAALDDGQAFKPSALAVHPETGRLYVLSSVRKALALVSPDGRLESVTPLPAALYAQPEGIAFAPDGTLFISNEAAGGTATLLRFTPRR